MNGEKSRTFRNKIHPHSFFSAFVFVQFSAESVKHSKKQRPQNGPTTGVFFYEQPTSSLIDAIKRFETVEGKFDPYEIRKNAERFSIEKSGKNSKNSYNRSAQLFQIK